MAPANKFKTLQLPQYDPFETVARCCHWDTYIKEKETNMITHVNHESNVKLKNRVVYFMPASAAAAEEYNKHGNISYVIAWDLVLDRLGPNMYFLGQAIDSFHGYTSVLLTSNDYDKKLRKVSLTSKGSPIIRSGGQFFHASSCLCEERLGTHEVIIVIESKRSAKTDAKWLFHKSDICANDHSLANIPYAGNSRCVKYTTICSMPCPFPWTFQQSKQMIKTVNPELTFTIGSVDQLSGGIEALHNQKAKKSSDQKEVDLQAGDGVMDEEITELTVNLDSASTLQVHDALDVNHLVNCIVMITAVVLVNLRFVLSNETMIQLMLVALVVALKCYVLPAIWPQQTATRTREETYDDDVNFVGSTDELNATENDNDEFTDSDEPLS